MTINGNPWLGLKSYEENDHLYGRQKESDELANIVINSFHTIIYGKSGIGKTSLLRAGVFPTLRYEDFMPIYIRLEHKENAEEEYYLRQIEEIVGETQGCASLQHIFSSTKYSKSRGIELMPVFVFDQFEEIFTLNENRDSEAVNRFFSELSDILNNESDGLNYRIVICLREDYLYYIERLSESIPAFKRNRYCLQDLTHDEAMEVITRPSPGMVDDAVAQEILRKLSPDNAGEVNATILSLYMSQLYDKMVKNGDAVITSSLVHQFGDDIISAFYFNSIDGVSERSIEYLEDHLVTTGGYRHNVPLEDALSNGIKQTEINHLKDLRILNIQPRQGNVLYMEYTHDVLCPIIVSNREQRTLRKKAKRLRRIVAAWVVFVLLLAGITTSFILQNRRITQQRDLMVQKQDSMLLMQSRAIAGQANQLFKDGKYINAAALCINALPKDLSHPDRPISYEAIDILYSFYYSDCALYKRMMKHGKRIYHASFSPDSRYVVASCTDNVAKIWDVESGRLVMVLKGHKNSVKYAKFSPDSKRIVTASFDSTAIVWDATTGKPIKRLVHKDAVVSAEFSRNGRFIVTASDSSVMIWNASTCSLFKTLNLSFKIRNTAISPDGKHIAIIPYYDHPLCVFNIATGEQLFSFETKHYVSTVRYSNDGKYLLVDEHPFSVLDANTGNVVKSFNDRGYGIVSTFSPDGNHIVISSWNDTVRILDFATGEQVRKIKFDNDYCSSIEYSPNGKYLLMADGNNDGIVAILNLNAEKTYHSFDNDNGLFINPAAFSPDGNCVALSQRSAYNGKGWSCTHHSTVDIVDLRKGEIIKSIKTDTFVSLASYSPDGKYLVTTGTDSIVRVWNVSTGDKIMTLDANNVLSAKFSPDGHYIATCSYDSVTRLWDANTGALIRKYKGHKDIVNMVSFSPDCRLLATASKDKTAKIWNVSTGKLIKSVVGHNAEISCVAFSPDGNCIATSSLDSTVRIWSMPDFKQVKMLDKVNDIVLSVCFSPDGRYVISSYGTNARIWEVSTGKAIRNFDNCGYYQYASFTPDGHYVMTNSKKLYRFIEPQDLIDHFHKVVGDYKFTPEEEIKYYLK